MKHQVLSFLQENIGKHCSEHLQGFGSWLNARLLEVSEQGDLLLEFKVREEMLNPLGTLHGGAISAMLDEAMGMQLFVKSGEEDAFFAINIVVDFVKNAKFGELLTVSSEIVRIGRNTANLRCTMRNANGEVVAHGSSNFQKIKGN